MVVGGYFFFFMSVCIGYVVYISESRHIQEGPIRQNFPLFI